MSERERFIAVVLDKRTGTHKLLNVPSRSHSECIALCQSLGPVQQHDHRLLMLAHKQEQPA